MASLALGCRAGYIHHSPYNHVVDYYVSITHGLSTRFGLHCMRYCQYCCEITLIVLMILLKFTCYAHIQQYSVTVFEYSLVDKFLLLHQRTYPKPCHNTWKLVNICMQSTLLCVYETRKQRLFPGTFLIFAKNTLMSS